MLSIKQDIRYTIYPIHYTLYAIRYTLYAIRVTLYAIRDTRYAIRFALKMGGRGGHPVLQVHSRSYTKNCNLPVSSQPHPMGAAVPARTAAMQFASFLGESRRVFHKAWPLRVHGREP